MEENVIVSVEISRVLDRQILEEAAEHGHNNRSAVIRMALNSFFNQKFAKIRTQSESERKGAQCQTPSAER